MWWVEQAERETENETQARYRQKKARRWVDQRLKDYYVNDLLPQSYAEAEALLNRAIVEVRHKGLVQGSVIS